MGAVTRLHHQRPSPSVHEITMIHLFYETLAVAHQVNAPSWFLVPCAAGSRFPLAGFPLAGVAPGFPRDQRPQSLPNTGWPGVSPAPVARSFLLAGGAGLLLARKPGVVLCRVTGCPG
jgi:hypothetical protein